MAEVGLDYVATKGIDLVFCVEALSEIFGTIWQLTPQKAYESGS